LFSKDLVAQATAVYEKIVSAQVSPEAGSPWGVALRTFVSEKCGSSGFSTGAATFRPEGKLPNHTRPFCEAITVLKGKATILVEGRAYVMSALDSIHIPADIAHSVYNSESKSATVVHWAFASSEPVRNFVDCDYLIDHRGQANPGPGDPETIMRFANSDKYELSEGAIFVDLFARRFGAKGICGGYGEFAPGAFLPCHVHDFDESITIVDGRALCLVQGQRYKLSGLDTAFVPTGRPHRFFNDSDVPMSMLWVYAGAEPDRTLIDPRYCDASLAWLGGRRATGG
jgi:putative monooxygenase